MRIKFSLTIHAALGVAAIALAAWTPIGGTAWADTWPTYMHDSARSGVTAEQLTLPLSQTWIQSEARGPRPAWDENPSLQDFWNGYYNNRTRMPNEDAFHVVVDADSVYYGSSNTGKVTALNATNASERWKFFSDGPVRYAPTIYNGKVYFGSDDGYVYCLNATDGSKVWSVRATSSNELMFVNGRMVSVCPVRTGVVVDASVAYWGAGFFEGAQTGLERYRCAFNADTGAQVWKIAASTPARPLQGYPLANATYLYMPTGKSTPLQFQRSNGTYVGAFDANNPPQGGAYALLTSDNTLFFGPHYHSTTAPWIGDYNATTRAYLGVAWVQGNSLVVTASYSYFVTDTTIGKVNRSNQQAVWTLPNSYPSALILAGNTLFVGGDDAVAARSADDGSVQWTNAVSGRVRGLAVASGALYVSADSGNIYRFAASGGGDTIPPTPNPMTWATPPYATGSTSIAMIATTASDPSGVEYYFTCTAGGGHDSPWQDSPSYTDTGLTPNTQYTYTVKARDKSANQNTTAASAPASATTPSGPVTYYPGSYAVVNGSYVSGTVANLVAADSVYLVFSSQTTGTTRYATVDFTVTGITGGCSRIDVTVVAKSSQATTTQNILLWNYTTSAWDQKDSASIGTSNVTRTFSVTTGASSYVSGGQLKVRTDASKSRKTFNHSLDQVAVAITP